MIEIISKIDSFRKLVIETDLNDNPKLAKILAQSNIEELELKFRIDDNWLVNFCTSLSNNTKTKMKKLAFYKNSLSLKGIKSFCSLLEINSILEYCNLNDTENISAHFFKMINETKMKNPKIQIAVFFNDKLWKNALLFALDDFKRVPVYNEIQSISGGMNDQEAEKYISSIYGLYMAQIKYFGQIKNPRYLLKSIQMVELNMNTSSWKIIFTYIANNPLFLEGI